MNNILESVKTLKETEMEIAARVKLRRKQQKLTQEELSLKSGVSLGSLKRFENKGKVSFEALIKIAIALDYQEDIFKLFADRKYHSIEEIINESNQ